MDISPAPTRTTLPDAVVLVALGIVVGVRVLVAFGVEVAVLVEFGIAVGVLVLVAFGVAVLVKPGVGVVLLSAVGVRVTVGDALLPPEVSTISCGAFAPDSRLAKLMAVLPGVMSPRLYVPLPVI